MNRAVKKEKAFSFRASQRSGNSSVNNM